MILADFPHIYNYGLIEDKEIGYYMKDYNQNQLLIPVLLSRSGVFPKM